MQVEIRSARRLWNQGDSGPIIVSCLNDYSYLPNSQGWLYIKQGYIRRMAGCVAQSFRWSYKILLSFLSNGNHFSLCRKRWADLLFRVLDSKTWVVYAYKRILVIQPSRVSNIASGMGSIFLACIYHEVSCRVTKGQCFCHSRQRI